MVLDIPFNLMDFISVGLIILQTEVNVAIKFDVIIDSAQSYVESFSGGANDDTPLLTYSFLVFPLLRHHVVE